MKEALNAIIGFFKDLGTIGNYIYKFSTDDEIARLRVFLVWFVVALIPSVAIAFTINTWQVHIPGVEVAQNGSGSVWGNIAGTSILPILFFITKGLRGYHEMFNNILEAFFSNLERRTMEDMIKEYGEKEALKKVKKVDLGRYISAFLLLEFIIIGWATTNYFFFGGALTGLGLAGYVLDDLLMGAIVLVLEGVYSVADGVLEAPSVYKLKPVELPNFAATNVKEAFEEVDRSDVW